MSRMKRRNLRAITNENVAAVSNLIQEQSTSDPSTHIDSKEVFSLSTSDTAQGTDDVDELVTDSQNFDFNMNNILDDTPDTSPPTSNSEYQPSFLSSFTTSENSRSYKNSAQEVVPIQQSNGSGEMSDFDVLISDLMSSDNSNFLTPSSSSKSNSELPLIANSRRLVLAQVERRRRHRVQDQYQ